MKTETYRNLGETYDLCSALNDCQLCYQNCGDILVPATYHCQERFEQSSRDYFPPHVKDGHGSTHSFVYTGTLKRLPYNGLDKFSV